MKINILCILNKISIDLNTFKLLHSYERFLLRACVTASCLLGILTLISFN